MQRSFSFQAHDDDPSYRPISPPIHSDSLPSSEPLPYRTPQRSPYDPAYPHTRHDSTSTVSTVSSVSSVRGGAAGGGGLAPSPRAFQQDPTMYSQQTPARPRSSLPPRRPIAAAGGNTGHHEQYWDEPGTYNRRGEGVGGGGGGGGGEYFAPPQHSSDTLFTNHSLHSPSSMSQTHTPLINGTSARFADPVTPTLPRTPPHRIGTLDNRSADRVLNDPVGGHYTDNPYSRYSTTWDPQLSARQVQTADADTFVFSDDEDERYTSTNPAPRKPANIAVPVAAPVERGLLGSGGGSAMLNEKSLQSEWMQKQKHSKKKTRWVVIAIVVVLLLAAVGGTVAGVLLSKKKGGTTASASSSPSTTGVGGGGGLTESEDIKKNGDLDKDSPEIKAILNNPKLHKVFHGIDYTPMNSQYPDCLNNPPTQNNVTRDVAAMSLLTDKLRLYGTDCNQTEMVLHAITALDIPMKIWLGVWLDYNTTTNTRQLSKLYQLLSAYPSTRFEGVAVGNEVLFREDLSEQQLFSTIADVRHNLTALSIDLPVGTSDLGSNWKASMVPYVDVLMANVHPFFAGVIVEKAASWTWDFFMDNDVVLTNGLATKPRVMISEVGWPSAGGNDSGSVAGIQEMNRFMDDFVCQENAKGTEYFWFSAFDEPWKVIYNTPGKQWEDKWGLMDVDRNLKDGLVIPDCK